MTKEEFKELWETNESGITWDLLANLAKEWVYQKNLDVWIL